MLDKCLSGVEVNKLFNSTKKRQRVLAIDRQNFDTNKENCIVPFMYFLYHKSSYW